MMSTLHFILLRYGIMLSAVMYYGFMIYTDLCSRTVHYLSQIISGFSIMGRNQRISIVFFVKIIFLISIILILLMINSLTRYLLLVISTSLKSILQYPMSAQYHSFYFQYKYI